MLTSVHRFSKPISGSVAIEYLLAENTSVVTNNQVSGNFEYSTYS